MTTDEARDRFKAVVSEHVTDFQAAYLINMAALDYVEASMKWLLEQYADVIRSATGQAK